MPKYVIEREVGGVARLPAEGLGAISGKSCGVIRALGPPIQWLESRLTDDRIYCIYIAANPEIRATIGPTTGGE